MINLNKNLAQGPCPKSVIGTLEYAWFAIVGNIVHSCLLWLVVARNAVVVILCAGIAASLYNDDKKNNPENFFTLTGKVKEGIPTPAVPSFTFSGFDEHHNTTVTKTTAEMFSVRPNSA